MAEVLFAYKSVELPHVLRRELPETDICMHICTDTQFGAFQNHIQLVFKGEKKKGIRCEARPLLVFVRTHQCFLRQQSGISRGRVIMMTC